VERPNASILPGSEEAIDGKRMIYGGFAPILDT